MEPTNRKINKIDGKDLTHSQTRATIKFKFYWNQNIIMIIRKLNPINFCDSWINLIYKAMILFQSKNAFYWMRNISSEKIWIYLEMNQYIWREQKKEIISIQISFIRFSDIEEHFEFDMKFCFIFHCFHANTHFDWSLP